MKTKKILLLTILSTIFFIGCDETYLDKMPLDKMTPEVFFTKANDFELYSNQFYDYLGDVGTWDFGIYDDEAGTDNLITRDFDLHYQGLTIKQNSDEEWTDNYSKIRTINFLLDNVDKAPLSEIKQYVGEAKFFRAFVYFKLLKRFGGVPWIDRPLTTDDVEGLNTPRSSRKELVDNIIADLDDAIDLLKEDRDQVRIYKNVALLFKSRVALYEGTWEKHHGRKSTPFAVSGSDGTAFLQMAMDAASQVILSGKHEIYKEGNEPFHTLFGLEDHSGNREVLLWRRYLNSLGQKNQSVYIHDGYKFGVTKDLVEAFLAKDGLPISLTPYEIKDDSITVLFENRDPRLKQFLYYPGYIYKVLDSGEEVPFTFSGLNGIPTGYHFKKGASETEQNQTQYKDETAVIFFRYTEALLNYIEAKAELFESGSGVTLSQSDFDMTINKLRDRIGMPHFDFSLPIVDEANHLTGDVPWYIVEIRRERRIELALEGFRHDDIMRWAAADRLLKSRLYKGAKLEWWINNGHYPEGLYVTDDEGYLFPWKTTEVFNTGGYQFNLNRDYLMPLPRQEETLAGYEPNPGWED